jgi:uncharacterized protein YbjT (DUF2867 family)
MRIAIAGATGLVGRPLVEAARAAGHDVVELSRGHGVDLAAGTGIDLTGVDAVIDVTNSPDPEEAAATAFFTSVAEHLGAAATAAGVRRTVVLSIIGVDAPGQDGHHAAKLAHERATQAHAPGARVLRAAQFHDFPGQMLGRMRDGGAATIPDMRTQPVDLAEVVRLLLELATADDPPALTEIAGPRRERLPDLVEPLDPAVRVTPGPVNDAIRDGALLPGPDAVIAGPDYATWLASSRAGTAAT